jgi:hypothetical protein
MFSIVIMTVMTIVNTCFGSREEIYSRRFLATGKFEAILIIDNSGTAAALPRGMNVILRPEAGMIFHCTEGRRDRPIRHRGNVRPQQ